MENTMNKLKLNSKVELKAPSLRGGTIIGMPDEDTNMYTIELASGMVIRCTEHYIGQTVIPTEGAKWRKK
jgi:hypothetical protein